jgi:hypothetical protein
MATLVTKAIAFSSKRNSGQISPFWKHFKRGSSQNIISCNNLIRIIYPQILIVVADVNSFCFCLSFVVSRLDSLQNEHEYKFRDHIFTKIGIAIQHIK